MAKKNKKIIPLLLVSAFAVIGVVGTTVSCGNEGGNGDKISENQTCSITWDVGEHARVTEGKVDSIASGEKITFKVEVDEHYEIVSVKAGSSRKSGKDGVYSFAINDDVTISITVQKIVSGVEVTTKPTKLVYTAGEDIDVTGMVVSVKYEDGTSSTIDNKDVSVYTGEAASTSFSGGETSFYVEYGDYKIRVELEKVVEYLVTINPNGATVKDSYYAKIEALGLNNYRKNNDGSISFTYYNNLPSEGVAVPGADEMEYVDHAFKQWSEGTLIKNNSGSVSTQASWQAQLVAITECTMVVEGGTPYLVVKGTFKAANKVSLFLHEGNKNIDLNGPEYTGTRDAEFNVKYDLSNLANKAAEDSSYFGAWMDIKFVAEDANGKETMEIFVTDPSISVNEDTKIRANGYSYSFANWEGALKVYVNESGLTYTTSLVKEGDNTYLVLAGETSATYAGKSVYVSWWNGSTETEPDVAPIASNGSFTMKINVNKFNADSMAYAHGGIVEDNDGEYTFISGGTGENFTGSGMLNEFVKFDKKAGDIATGARFESDGYAYYIGSPWGGLCAYYRNEAQSVELNKAYLEEKDGVVYYVAEGSIKGYDSLNFDYDFQHNGNIDGQGWNCPVSSRVFENVTEEDVVAPIAATISGSVVKVMIPVSTLIPQEGLADATSGWTFSVHMGPVGAAKDFKPSEVDSNKITLNGVEYSIIQNSDTWSMAALVMKTVA